MRKQFEILVVDDEPDVRAITRLAMKGIRCFGVGVRVHECATKSEAVRLLDGKLRAPEIAVALVDVVMETDSAGLDVCEHIRNVQNNKVTQVVVRTGQAGKAPEREVLDGYDISGYVTKVEATEGRLYSVLKSSIRQFYWSRLSQLFFQLYGVLIPASTSPKSLTSALRGFIADYLDLLDGPLAESLEKDLCLFVDGERIGFGIYADATVADADRARFDGKTGGARDRDYLLGEEHILLRSHGDDGTNIDLLTKVGFPPPEFFIAMWKDFLVSLRALLALSRRAARGAGVTA